MFTVKKLAAGLSLLAISAMSSAASVSNVSVVSIGLDKSGNGTVAVSAVAPISSDCIFAAAKVVASTDNGRALLELFKFAKQTGALLNVDYTINSPGACTVNSAAVHD